VHAVGRAHGLSWADAQDVYQVTWLRLLTHLQTIREPEKIGAWLTSTARHESWRVLRRLGRQVPVGSDAELEASDPLAPPPEARLVGNERQMAVWAALATLSAACQRLLRLMMTDPPPSYEEVSAALNMPIGSIGPTRRRCLEKLRAELGGINDDG
jgi:RNA polymerase sigma factor (sigma-70 family)